MSLTNKTISFLTLHTLLKVLLFLNISATTILSVMPGSGHPPTGQWDKLQHFLAYGSIYFLVLWVLQTSPAKKIQQQAGQNYLYSNKVKWLWFAALCAMGITMEIIQIYVPNRSGSLADIVANISGLGFGFLAFKLLAKTSKFKPGK